MFDEDDALPLRDIDEAIQSELSMLQYSRLRSTGTGRKTLTKHSEEKPKIVHSEL